MKRLILIVAILALATMAFGQGSSHVWPKDWGRTGSWVEYETPYQATGYVYEPSGPEYWVGGTETGKSYFTVTCDIEMYMSMHFDATDIYFHIADDRTSMSAYVNGWIASNNGQWLFVSSEMDTKKITELKFIQNIFGGTTPANCPPIPVEWWLTDDTDGGVYRLGEYSQGGNYGTLWGVTWLIAKGEPCTHYFTIRVDIKPAFHQPDGRYEMDPLVTISPVI